MSEQMVAIPLRLLRELSVRIGHRTSLYDRYACASDCPKCEAERLLAWYDHTDTEAPR